MERDASNIIKCPLTKNLIAVRSEWLVLYIELHLGLADNELREEIN